MGACLSWRAVGWLRGFEGSVGDVIGKRSGGRGVEGDEMGAAFAVPRWGSSGEGKRGGRHA